MLNQFTQSYIILDALDECNDRAVLMDILKKMAAWKFEHLHLLVTSRRERDIESSLELLLDKQNTICLQSDLVDKDIHLYVRQRLTEDKSLKKWQKDPNIALEIETALMKGTHGMFRWAACQLDSLTKCLSRSMLRKALINLPPTLDSTYERILCSIEKDYSEYALRILQRLAFSARPLSIEEVAEAIAIDVSRDPAFDREEVLEDPLDVLKVCSSLVTITTTESQTEYPQPERKVVVLAHYSVKEYLISERSRRGPAMRYSLQATTCNEFITQCCLGYLLQFKASDCLSYNNIQDYTLASYSARYWITHFRAVEKQSGAMDGLIMELFSTTTETYLNWIRIHDPERPSRGFHFATTLDRIPTPLYYASQYGFFEIVRLQTLEAGVDINKRGRVLGNSLQAASHFGHENIVQLLLRKGADINMHCGTCGNSLQAASFAGHDSIVQLLLSNGAYVNAPGGWLENSLQAASHGGYDKIIELLLSSGADVNIQDGHFGNAIQAASARGHDTTVKLLLRKGADVNAKGGEFGSALRAVSYHGHVDVVEVLLSNGAGVTEQSAELANDDADCGVIGSALLSASFRGHAKVVELLLRKGTGLNRRCGELNDSLEVARSAGHDKVVQLLLSKGARFQ